jgi:uncharacterized protein YcaQ
MTVTIATLRRYAVARSLFAPTTLVDAVERMGGFVQADPLRAPARAQDLTLRPRVQGYKHGQLEQAYPTLPLKEDFFVNYGFVTPALRACMHPREARTVWTKARWTQASEVLACVRALGVAHPKDVDAALQQGTVDNWFGGKSRLSTELLDGLHFRGLLDVVKRDNGTRCYAVSPPWAPHPDPIIAIDALVNAAVQTYAPLPQASLSMLLTLLFRATHQWRDLKKPALARATARLAHATVDGTRWFWPADEDPCDARWAVSDEGGARVRLLAPFDPVVWDRRRFELLWGWAYRFEAYTPAAKRVRGHYALPLLWGDAAIGWANLAVDGDRLTHDVGFVHRRPRGAAFTRALAAELDEMAAFLDVTRS